MSGEIINLRMARKRRDRAEKEATAERNRFEHGRSKAERELARARNQKSERDHAASRRDLAATDQHETKGNDDR